MENKPPTAPPRWDDSPDQSIQVNPKKQNKWLILLLIILVIAIGLIVGSVIFIKSKKTSINNQTVQPEPEKPVVVMTVGDITCDPTDPKADGVDPARCQDAKVAELVRQSQPDKLMLLGDIQYDNGTLEKFKAGFGKNWAEFSNLIIPTPGNHEYATAQAKGYYDYFNGADAVDGKAGKRGQGFYKTEINGWSVYSLNSNCKDIGGCNVGSTQYNWLDGELKNDINLCKMAIWHHPLFTSGKYFNNQAETKRMADIWQLLNNKLNSLILNGHDHIYERFDRQDNTGQANQNGIREFVIGTGGKQLYKRTGQAPNSEYFNDSQFGSLQLSLYKQKYSWKFKDIGGNILDQGEEECIRSK